MSDLYVARLSASVQGAEGSGGSDGAAGAEGMDPQRLGTILDQVATGRLDEALGRVPLPDGEWCVRRLDVPVTGDLDRPDGALATHWADAIVVALRQSLRDGSCDVVRFERRDDAVDDLLTGLALRDSGREWAWRQLGLLLPGEDPATGARAVTVRTLAGLPHGVAGALHRLVRRTGVAAVHRLLGAAGWTAVAGLALRDLPGDPLLDLLAAGSAVPPRTPLASSAPMRHAAGTSPARRRVDRMLLPADELARLLRDSGLRVDEATARAWAVLAVAAADPRALLGAEAESLLLTMTDVLVGAPAGRPPYRGGPSTPERRPDAAVEERPLAIDRDQDLRPAPTASGPGSAPAADGRRDVSAAADPAADPAVDAGVTRAAAARSGRSAWDGRVPAPTEWGGLLFLLNTAPDAGLPEALDQRCLADRPMPWLLARIATRLLPVGADDPAVRALCGVDPLGPDPVDGATPEASEEVTMLDAVARTWTSETLRRLDPEAARDRASLGDVEHPLAGVLRRPARIEWEPGWVEVHLALGDVDIAARRAGLDLDPGWVWWLGQVVRFRYE